jgi:hypothetical protein
MPNYHGHIEISRAFLEIDGKFESMKEFKPKSTYDLQIQSLFSQYMVIFISRTIEGSIKNIIYTKCKVLGKSQNEMQEIETKIKQFQNPSWEKICFYYEDILSIELNNTDFTTNHFIALSQIVKDRNRFAHSDHLLETVPNLKTLDDVKKHYIEIKDFISKLCEITVVTIPGLQP